MNLELYQKVPICLRKQSQPLCYNPNLAICQPLGSFTSIDYQHASRFVGETRFFSSPEAHVATRGYGGNSSVHGCDEEHEGICLKNLMIICENDEVKRCAGNGVDSGVVEGKFVKGGDVCALGEVRIQ